jgi:hypothetical protein
MALGGAVAVVVVGITSALVFFGDGDSPDQRNAPSLSGLAAEIKGYSLLDFDHLADQGLTLSNVADASDLVGIGRIVDVRAAWKEVEPNPGGGSPDELLHMYLVIEPDRLARGGELLGRSGEVLVDEIAPPVDRKAGDIAEQQRDAIAAIREATVGSPERVAFMLSSWPPGSSVVPPPPVEEVVTDEFAGRKSDDPVFAPTQPSSLIVLDERTGVAYPLTTDEKFDESPGNLDALEQLGAKVDHFAGGSDAATGGQL